MSANEETNELGIFKNLELIPMLYNKIDSMESEIAELKKELIPKLNLTKRADVLKFLEISNAKLENMMNDGRFVQGKHFIREHKGKQNKITFISQAVIDFKEQNL